MMKGFTRDLARKGTNGLDPVIGNAQNLRGNGISRFSELPLNHAAETAQVCTVFILEEISEVPARDNRQDRPAEVGLDEAAEARREDQRCLERGVHRDHAELEVIRLADLRRL